MHLYRARESKFVLPEIIWHYCFLELSLSRHRSLNNSCELNSRLEFSGLHYCLFVKEHSLFLCVCFCLTRQLIYNITRYMWCQHFFQNIFIFLFFLVLLTQNKGLRPRLPHISQADLLSRFSGNYGCRASSISRFPAYRTV